MPGQDRFSRTLSQVFLLVLVLSFIALAVLFDYVVYFKFDGTISSEDVWAYEFVRGLKISFETEIAPFIAAILGALPMFFSLACFRRNRHNDPDQSRFEVSLFGKFLSILLVIGILISISAPIFIDLFASTIDSFISFSGKEGASEGLAPKGIFTSILSFECMYLIHILGVKRR